MFIYIFSSILKITYRLRLLHFGPAMLCYKWKAREMYPTFSKSEKSDREWHWHSVFAFAHVKYIRFPISLPQAFPFIKQNFTTYSHSKTHWQKPSTIWSSKGYALQTRWRFPVVPLNPLCRGVCGKREGVSDQRSPPRANFLTESRLRSAGWAFGCLKSPVGNCDVRYGRAEGCYSWQIIAMSEKTECGFAVLI